jgi:enoyl-CoA hydratase/carnithine racemase
MQPIIVLEINDNVATVTLNRPDKHNALNIEMFEAIVAIQRQLAGIKNLRAVIIKANGEDFCSGLDVKSVLSSKIDPIKLLWKWLPWRPNLAQQVCVGWRQLSIPVIAAIHGRCWGGGMQLVLGCDFRFASPDANFSIMESRWGLIPDMGGTLALRESLSCDQAMQLAMTAEQISANDAKDLGLITEQVDDPYAHATEFVKKVAKRSPDAVAAIKRLYVRHWFSANGKILSRETGYQWRILLGKNQRIAVAKERGKAIDYVASKRW